MRIKVIIEEELSTLHISRALRTSLQEARKHADIDVNIRPMHQAVWSGVYDRIQFTMTQAAKILTDDSAAEWGVYVATDTFNFTDEKGPVTSPQELLIIAIQSRDGRRLVTVKSMCEKKADSSLKETLHDALAGAILSKATVGGSADIELATMSELVWAIYEAACTAPKIAYAMSANRS